MLDKLDRSIAKVSQDDSAMKLNAWVLAIEETEISIVSILKGLDGHTKLLKALREIEKEACRTTG